jgi:hypothetical protein
MGERIMPVNFLRSRETCENYVPSFASAMDTGTRTRINHGVDEAIDDELQQEFR